MPRPRHKKTPERAALIRSAAQVFTQHHSIARAFKISIHTLLKHYAKELAEGEAHGEIAVAKRLYMIAMGDDLKAAIPAAIFIAKAKLKWREVVPLEVSGPNGKPLAPPKLGVSFPDGGPGHGNPTAIDVSNSQGEAFIEMRGDERDGEPSALDEPVLTIEQPKAPQPARIEHQPAQPLAIWDPLGDTPQEFAERKAREAAVAAGEPVETDAEKDARLRTVGRWTW